MGIPVESELLNPVPMAPTAMVAAFAAAARLGIMIKQTRTLEAAADVDTVILDKTGTLTTGRFAVSRLAPATGVEGHGAAAGVRRDGWASGRDRGGRRAARVVGAVTTGAAVRPAGGRWGSGRVQPGVAHDLPVGGGHLDPDLLAGQPGDQLLRGGARRDQLLGLHHTVPQPGVEIGLQAGPEQHVDEHHHQDQQHRHHPEHRRGDPAAQRRGGGAGLRGRAHDGPRSE